MSQTSSERRRFPVPLRWLDAGGDLSQPDLRQSMHPAPVDPLKRPPRRPSHALARPCVQASRSRRPSVAPTSELRANLKSP